MDRSRWCSRIVVACALSLFSALVACKSDDASTDGGDGSGSTAGTRGNDDAGNAGNGAGSGGSGKGGSGNGAAGKDALDGSTSLDDSGSDDVDGHVHSGTDAGADSGSDAGGDSGGSCTTVTVKNHLVWCDVSVNGGAASSAATQTVCVAPGTISVTAAPLSGFELGPWHHTDGDPGTGENSATASITVGSTDKCVWICCPFTGGSGCPAASSDQCP